jgi:putative Holliday junction resolvase
VTREARPLATVDVAGSAVRWAALGRLIADWQPARLVVGIPLHPDGAPHEMTARCERFARQLEGRFRLPVERVDERYSSAVAAHTADVDAAAAALILQQWFDNFDDRAEMLELDAEAIYRQFAQRARSSLR